MRHTSKNVLKNAFSSQKNYELLLPIIFMKKRFFEKKKFLCKAFVIKERKFAKRWYRINFVAVETLVITRVKPRQKKKTQIKQCCVQKLFRRHHLFFLKKKNSSGMISWEYCIYTNK